MVKVYYNLIKKNLRKIDDVPDVWRKEVEDMLATDE